MGQVNLSPLIHVRKGNTFSSLCGLGYNYPSGILFENEDRLATCPKCCRIDLDTDIENYRRV